MELTEKHLSDYKELFKKEYGKELTDQEVFEGAHNLLGLVEILYDGHLKELSRKKKLESFPKGFHLEGSYSCHICGNSMTNEQTWYDKNGMECMTCQKGINRKEIPTSVARDSDSWYSKYDLERDFCLKGAVLKSWIKSGILKVRTITNDSGRVHIQLFLIKDNKGFLPPKKLVESRLVKEVRDGQDWYHSEPWYKFGDPYKHLKGYKIMDYLRLIHKEEGEDSRLFS